MIRVLVAVLMVAGVSAANAKIIPENWRPCGDPANGFIHRDGGTWGQIPTWARAPAIAAYYDNDEILLSNHGLCNEKFHRVVLCLPGWHEGGNEEFPWFKVCKTYELTR